MNIISTKSHDTSYLDANGGTVSQTWNNSNGYLTGAYKQPEGRYCGRRKDRHYPGSRLLPGPVQPETSRGQPVISVVLKGNSKGDLYKIMSQMLSNFSN